MGVSLYLAVVWLVMLVTFRIRLDLPAILAYLRTRGGPAGGGDARPEPSAATSPAPSGDTPERSTGPGRGFELADWIELFRCPRCGERLSLAGDELACTQTHRFPVLGGIPRFVGGDAYVRSFSREWNTHRTTQLDSHGATRISEDTLRTKTGLSPEDVAGKLVLDAGTGSGRFAEVLARWGARVVGVDLSYAVEAARHNLASASNVCIAQADIGQLPFAPATFDAIVSIGVLHHTPDTRRAFEALVPLLAPGGTIAIWVYPDEGAYKARKPWIPFTSRIPADAFHDWCAWLVPWTHRHPRHPLTLFLRVFFPFSRQGLGVEWDVLDTFDGYSPRYHGIHTPTDVIAWFRAAGLEDVREAGPVHTSVRGVRAST